MGRARPDVLRQRGSVCQAAENNRNDRRWRVSPPKQKRAPAKSALQSLEQLIGYLTSCVLQARRRLTRHCVACGARVPNRNFDGYDGKGALSGPSVVRFVAGPKAKEEQ